MSKLTSFLETATLAQLDSLLESIQSAQNSMGYEDFVKSLKTVREIEAAKEVLLDKGDFANWKDFVNHINK